MYCEIRTLPTGEPFFHFSKRLERPIHLNKSGFFDLRRVIHEMYTLIYCTEIYRNRKQILEGEPMKWTDWSIIEDREAEAVQQL